MQFRLILLGAEILAVAVLHLVFMLRRDGTIPKGSKVPWIRGIPVLKNSLFKRKVPPPQSQPFSVGGWTPPPRPSRMPDTPDNSPGT